MEKEIVKEKHFVRVFSSTKTKDEKPRFLEDDIILYCALDNHKCDGPCRKTNTDRNGCLCCSEVITEEFLPKKRRSRKRFKRREREDEF